MSRMRLAAPLMLAVALVMAAGPAAAQRASPQGNADVPAALQPGDAFGESVTLPERTMIYIKGQGKWDAAFETLVDAFKSLNEYLDKQGIKPSGSAMTIYTETDDAGFAFEAAYPIAVPPKDPPKGDIAVGPTPTGKALKFVHRGSYDAMDSTYEAITNYLDDKHLEAQGLFIEEYVTDPVKTKGENLVVNVYVPVK